ncbi:unnamed protein product [Alopecurus aequalis]
MMDPAQTPQGAGPIPCTTCGDAKRQRRCAMPAGTICKVLDDDYASSLISPAPPLDDENLLEDILLRLPLKPSSLLRASLVCRRWRDILSDPEFIKRFRKHHLKPPLLGFFIENKDREYNFAPVLNTKPNRIPAERFAAVAEPRSSSPYGHWEFLGYRHGLGVLIHYYRREVAVWDPLTSQKYHVPFPLGLRNDRDDISCTWHATVFCANAEDGHVHGDCFSGLFKLVLIGAVTTETFACIYESVSGVWGNIVSISTTTTSPWISPPSVLIGNALYWLFGGAILAFDTDKKTLDEIEKPTDAYHTGWSFQLWRTNDDCGLGLAVTSKFGIHLWEWKMNREGIFRWVLQPRVIKLDGLFPQRMRSDQNKAIIVGYDEESNVIVLSTYIGNFMLNLESMRFRRICERNCWYNKIHYPYRNFYTAGNTSLLCMCQDA